MTTKILGSARVIAVVFGVAALAGCTNMDSTQQRMLSGGALGATAGTLGVVMTGGCIPCGTVVGGAVGAAGGFLIEQLDTTTKSSGGYSSSSSPGYSSSTSSGYPGYSSGDSSGYSSGNSYGSSQYNSDSYSAAPSSPSGYSSSSYSSGSYN